MENISTGPTFGDFVTIRTEAATQDVTFARLQSTRVQNPLSPSLLNLMYCVRVSLRNTKEKGVVGNLCLSLIFDDVSLMITNCCICQKLV
jgi:hypothetical protein